MKTNHNRELKLFLENWGRNPDLRNPSRWLDRRLILYLTTKPNGSKLRNISCTVVGLFREQLSIKMAICYAILDRPGIPLIRRQPVSQGKGFVFFGVRTRGFFHTYLNSIDVIWDRNANGIFLASKPLTAALMQFELTRNG